MQGHIQSISRDGSGVLEGANTPLATPNGGVTVGPATNWFAVSQLTSEGDLDGSYIIMQQLEAVCLATGMSPGAWQIYNSTGAGGTILKVIPQPIPSAAGLRYVWDFPTPLQTGSLGFGNFGFHVRPTVSGMGTWFFTANGHKTRIRQDPTANNAY